jgi:hypothetical protein
VKLFKKIRFTFQNLSAAAVRDIIVVIVILCLSVAFSIPSLKQDLKEYQKQKIERENEPAQTSTIDRVEKS